MSLQQYDVIPANAPYIYFVVLQSDLMQGLATRAVAPLVDATTVNPLDTLWPKVSVNNSSYVVLVPLMQSIRPDPNAAPVTNLSANASSLSDAVDLLFGTAD